MRKEIPIVLISSNEYIEYCAVVMSSVLYNLESEYQIHFYVLSTDLSTKNKQKLNLLKKIKNFNITYPHVDTSLLEIFKDIRIPSHVSPLTYLRILIPTLLPNLPKVIFLDCDIIVRKSISELYEYNLGNKYYGIVEDVANEINSIYLWGKKDKNYYNCGILLINSEQLRKDNYFEKVKEHILLNKDKYKICDQDIINDTFKNDILRLPIKWNFFHEYHCLKNDFTPINQNEYDKALKDPAIVHFVGQNKPWKPGTNHAYKKEFLFYYKMTPFYSYAKDIINKIKSCFYLTTQNNSVVVKKYLLGLLRIKKDIYSKEIRLLGIPLMQRKSNMNYTKMKFFAGLLQRIKYDDGLNKYYVFGIKILQTFNPYKYFNAKFNNINLENSTFKNNQLIFNEFINTNIVKNLHQKIFPPFKNIHAGQDVVIVGSGPTLNKYKVIDGAIHIGLNRTFENNSIKFDYIFAQDYPNLIKADADFYIKLQNYRK